MKKGFTLVEFLVGMTITALVFIIATNLMIGFLNVDTKSQRSQDLEQAKSDLTSEFTSSLQWANTVNFTNGVLTVDSNTYSVSNGTFLKNGSALTSNKVKIQNFKVERLSIAGTNTNTTNGEGLLGSYFSSNNLADLVLSRVDSSIDFNWGNSSPAQGVPSTNYSVQWQGQIVTPTTGLYTFYANTNSGVRLWIDNSLVFDNWLGSEGEVSGPVYITKNKLVSIRLDYHDNATPSHLTLRWSGPGVSKEIVPTSNLYPQSSQTGYLVSLDLVHSAAEDTHDAVSLFIAPRANSSQTVEKQ